METQPSTHLATKLAFSSSRKLYELLETFFLLFGDGWYWIFDRRFSVFCFKDHRLIGRCLWFISVEQSKQTKTRKSSRSKFWLVRSSTKVLHLNSFFTQITCSVQNSNFWSRQRYVEAGKQNKNNCLLWWTNEFN